MSNVESTYSQDDNRNDLFGDAIASSLRSEGQHYNDDPVDCPDEHLVPDTSRKPQPSPPGEPDAQYPSSLTLALIVLGVCLSVFIISMDRSIVITVSAVLLRKIHLEESHVLTFSCRPVPGSPINFTRPTI